MRAIPQVAIRFIEQHEGFSPTVYGDVGGVLTAGYGHTSPSLTSGQTVTVAQAVLWLSQDLDAAAERLAAKVKQPIIDSLTDNQYAALLSFVFNLGTPGTTIWKDLNAGNFDQVPADMMAFVYARVGGQEVKIQGLVNRRTDEIKLWSTDEPGSVAAAPSSSVTRSYATPAAPSDPKSRGGIGPAIATAATAATAAAGQAGQIIQNISKTLSPYADANDHVKTAISTLALVAAGFAVLTVFLVWARNRAVSKWEPTTRGALPPGSLPPAQGQPNAPEQQPPHH